MNLLGGKDAGSGHVPDTPGHGLSVDVNVYGMRWHIEADGTEAVCSAERRGVVRFPRGGVDGLVSSYISLLEEARESGLEA